MSPTAFCIAAFLFFLAGCWGGTPIDQPDDSTEALVGAWERAAPEPTGDGPAPRNVNSGVARPSSA